MNRRDFLKTSSIGLAGLSLSNLITSCNSNKKSDTPILVIGAGIAGLGAARALKGAGFSNITVLEGRNRIGGRIWTDRSLGFPVDLGASWIHGPKGGNPITTLAKSAGAEMFETNDEKLVIYNTNGAKIDSDTTDKYYKDYNNMLKSIESNGQAGQSFKDAVQAYNSSYLTDNIMKYQLSAYAEFDSGGAIEEMDAAYWQNDKKFPGKDVLFPDGYDAIVNLLAEGLNIRLNTNVTKIEHDSNGVKVTTSTAEIFNAAYIVCTLPLGVLKSGGITFSPALPADKQGAIQRLKMGFVNKTALVFPSAFWDTDAQYIGYCSDIKGQYPYFVNYKKIKDKNALLAFGFGNYGQTMEGQTTNQIGSDVMDVLRKIYGNAIPNYTQILTTKWTNDIFTRGSYSYMNKGASNADYDAFVSGIDDKLFFAGEHTISKYRGTVHGAYLSGLRQAERIMDLEYK